MRAIAAELLRLDQRDRVDDHDGRERRLRHQRDQRREQQQRRSAAAAVDQLGQLRARARACGSRPSATFRRRPASRRSSPPPMFADADRQQLPVRARARLVRSPRTRARPRCVSVKLISAMPSGGGPELRGQTRARAIRSSAARAARCRPSRRRGSADPETRRPRCPQRQRSSGAGARGSEALEREEQHDRSPADSRASGATTSRASARRSTSRSRKKPALWIWIPSSFGIWSTTITRPMPDLNPVSTGRR